MTTVSFENIIVVGCKKAHECKCKGYTGDALRERVREVTFGCTQRKSGRNLKCAHLGQFYPLDKHNAKTELYEYIKLLPADKWCMMALLSDLERINLGHDRIASIFGRDVRESEYELLDMTIFSQSQQAYWYTIDDYPSLHHDISKLFNMVARVHESEKVSRQTLMIRAETDIDDAAFLELNDAVDAKITTLYESFIALLKQEFDMAGIPYTT